MSRDLNARLVIGGDASGASRALNSLEGQMNALQRAGKGLAGIGGDLQRFSSGFMAAGGLGAGALALPVVSAFARMEASATDAKVAFMEAGGKINGVFAEIDKESERLAKKLPGSKENTDATARWLRQYGMAPEVIRDGALAASRSLGVLFKLTDQQASATGALLSTAFKLDGKQFAAGADVFQRVSYGLGIEAGEYAAAIANVSGTLNALNIKGLDGMKDTAVIFGQMKAGGITGSSAGTALDAMLREFAKLDEKLKTDKELAATLRKHNIKLDLTDGKGGMDLKALPSQLEQIKQKMGSVEALNVFSKLAGDEGKRAAMAIADGGVAGWNSTVDKLANQATLEQRLEAVTKTLESKWDSATGNVTGAMAKLGSVYEDTFKQVADAIGEAADQATGFIGKNQGVMAAAGPAALGVGALATWLGGRWLTGKALSMAGGGLGWLGGKFGAKPKPGDASSPAGLGAGLNVTPVRVMNWNEFGGKGAAPPVNTNPANQFDPKKTPTPANRAFDAQSASGGNTPGALETDPKKPSLLRRAAGGMGRAGRYGGLALAGMAGTALLSAPAEAAEGVKSGLDGAAMIASESATALQALSGSGALIGKLSGAGALLGKIVKPADWALKAWDFGQATLSGDGEKMGATAGDIGGSIAGAAAGAAIGGLIGGIAGSMAGEAGGGWLGRQASALFGGGKPEDKKPEDKKGGWFSGLFGGGKAPDLSLPKTPALTEIVSREGSRPGPGMGAASVTAPISITVNANGASPEVAAQVAKAVQDQSADIVRLITDHFERQRRTGF